MFFFILLSLTEDVKFFLFKKLHEVVGFFYAEDLTIYIQLYLGKQIFTYHITITYFHTQQIYVVPILQ